LSKANFITLTGTTLPSYYLSKASFNTWSGTTLSSYYLSKAGFNTFSGTTAFNYYGRRTQFMTYTGTTAPSTYALKSLFNAYTGSSIGVQDLFISAAAMSPRATSGCSAVQRVEYATSLANLQILEFSPTLQQFCQFALVLPRNWNRGTITCNFLWTSTGGTGGLVYGISAIALSDDDALTTAFGTRVTSVDQLIAAGDVHRTSGCTLTVGGSPLDSDLIIFQIDRDPTSASDNLATKSRLIGVVLGVTTDALTAT
jgi:hypothetical protein